MAEYIDEYIRKNDVYNLKNAFSSLIKEESTKHDGIEWVIYNRASESALNMIERGVQEIPAADVVEVVRCKDCAHVNVEVRDYAMYLPKQCELYCELDELPVKPDDFCSYGERKEDEPK